MDCDLVLSSVDCDDYDPDLGDITQDADCDMVLTADDCDDNNPALPEPGDMDCDGYAADDCDDANPMSILVRLKRVMVWTPIVTAVTRLVVALLSGLERVLKEQEQTISEETNF